MSKIAHPGRKNGPRIKYMSQYPQCFTKSKLIFDSLNIKVSLGTSYSDELQSI